MVAVIDRHHQDIMQVVRSALAQAAAQPIEPGVRIIITAAIEAHRIDPKLHRVVAEQIPRVGRLEYVETLNREGLALLQAYLESRRDELCVTDIGLVAFVCGSAIEALTHNAVLHGDGVLTKGAPTGSSMRPRDW